jgi:hypothetical protein
MQPDMSVDELAYTATTTSSTACTLHLKLPMCAGRMNALVSLKRWRTFANISAGLTPAGY